MNKKLDIQKFASGGGELTQHKTYEVNSSNIVETVTVFLTGEGPEPDPMEILGWDLEYIIRSGSIRLSKQFSSNSEESLTVNDVSYSISVTEIGETLPEGGVLTTYVSNFYFNSPDVPWSEEIWKRQPSGNYTITNVPSISQTNIDEYPPYGPEYEFKGWTMHISDEPQNMTVEEIKSLELFPQFIRGLDLDGSAWIEKKSSPPISTGINGIRLNGQCPSSVYIGNQEIIKIIYNGKVIYNKGEGLSGHTYADLASMTHEQLAQYTHAELAGE